METPARKEILFMNSDKTPLSDTLIDRLGFHKSRAASLVPGRVGGIYGVVSKYFLHDE